MQAADGQTIGSHLIPLLTAIVWFVLLASLARLLPKAKGAADALEAKANRDPAMIII